MVVAGALAARTIRPVLAQVYTYGHLVAAAFSLAVAWFYLAAGRLGERRADRWLPVVMYALFAAAGVVAMLVVLRPSLCLARAYLTVAGSLYACAAIAFHVSYGGVLAAARRRRRWRVVAAYTVTFAVIHGLLWSGVLDGGARVISRAGVTVIVPDLAPAAVVVMLLHVLWHPILLVPLLRAPGARWEERRTVAWVVLVAPLGAVHELLVCTGTLPSIPLGGYAANLTSIAGVLVLIERIRVLTAGPRVGHYVLERRLGVGGMAEVYLARREGAGTLEGVVQRVAFKRLLPDRAEEPNFVRMFLQEARIAARLAHPHIVALHEAGHDGGQLYMAMEYVDGISLSRLMLRRGRLRYATCVAVDVAVQLADALAYAHELRGDDGQPLEIIHRDLSPSNVLASRAGTVKLADFGIARSTDRDSDTTTGVIKGKLHYMAPEQIENRHYDHRVDVYALGVVMFELLTGARPFDGGNEVATLHRIMSGRVSHRELLEATAPALARLVLAVLSRDPDRRPRSAAALRDALLPFRDERRARAILARDVVDACGGAPSVAPDASTRVSPPPVFDDASSRSGRRGQLVVGVLADAVEPAGRRADGAADHRAVEQAGNRADAEGR